MGVWGAVVGRGVNGLGAPMVWVRLGRPTILLPLALASRLSDEQIECIACHELAHFVRRDHWTNAFALAVMALYWWNPVAWWARRELLCAQEESCDAMVIARAGVGRRQYAETLWQAIDYLNAQSPLLPMSASGLGRVSLLRRRFEMIASKRVSHRIASPLRVVILFSTAALFCLPVQGEQPQAETERAEAAKKIYDAKVQFERATGQAATQAGAAAPGVPVGDNVPLKYRTADVTVDATKHCLYVGQPPKAGQGALRVDLERGFTYTVRAAGKAFMSDETGDQADPFPGILLFYSIDDEDGYAVRQVMLKPGDSVSFTTPWLIQEKDEVFAAAAFVDAWADSPNQGGYTLTFTRSEKQANSVELHRADVEALRREAEALNR
jgi:hypothetical protein